ncbi:MAG: DoxX family protein [Chlamydiia bacterium]
MGAFWLSLGRVLMGILFLVSGIGCIINWDGVLQYFHTMVRYWETFFQQQHGMTAFLGGVHEAAMALVAVAVLLQLSGGALLIISYHVKLGAGLLIAFLLPASVFFQPFWFFAGQDGRLQQMMFLKNLAILGGLLYVVSLGKGIASKPSKPSS